MDVFHYVGEYVYIYHYMFIYEHMHSMTSIFRGREKWQSHTPYQNQRG